MSNLTTTQIENRAIIKHLVADAKKPDGHWSIIMDWNKDLFPDRDPDTMRKMGEMDLVELAKNSNIQAKQTAKQLLLHIAQSGMALIALKDICQHGSFKVHLFSIGIEPRTAQNYMAIARNYETVSHLRGAKDALRYIRDAQSTANKTDDWTIQGGPLPIDIGKNNTTRKSESEHPTIEAEVVDTSEYDDEKPDPEVSHEQENSEEIDLFTQALLLLPNLSKEERQKLFETLANKWDCKL